MAPKKAKQQPMEAHIVKGTPALTVSVSSADGLPAMTVDQPAAAAIITTIGPDGMPVTHLVGERDHLRALCMYILDDGLDECASNFLIVSQTLTVQDLLALLREKGN